MTDLVKMIAIEAGTVAGPEGIVHVNPESKRENGRYSHPVVSEETAQLLEKRKLAVRETVSLLATAELVSDDGTRKPLVPGEAVELGSGTEPSAPSGSSLGGAPDAPPVPATAAMGGDAGAATGSSDASTGGDSSTAGGGEIETGLSDGDPDAPPVPATAAAAAPAGKPGKKSA